MVTVEITRKYERIVSFTLSGHANAGSKGHDLVCAGVSAVSIGTVNAVDEICNVQLDLEEKEDGGFLRCVVPEQVTGETDEKVQLLLEGLVVSMNAMQEYYREYITVKDDGGECKC